MNEEDLVTVARFPTPAEASMARTALESAGIDAFLNGEAANILIPIAFESQLQVRRKDEAAAQEVLNAAIDDPASEEAVIEAEIANEAEPRA